MCFMKKVKLISMAIVGSFLAFSSLSAKDIKDPNSTKSSEFVFRKQFSNVVSSINFNEPGSVSVYFKISSRKFELINVKGSDNSLVDKVKAAIEKNKIEVPVGLDGKYQISVSFVQEESYQ